MIEVVGNLFEFDGDALCLTTNGQIRKDGANVMGRGVAQQATQKWPGIEYSIGAIIKDAGSIVRIVTQVDTDRGLSARVIPVHAGPKHLLSRWNWPRPDCHVVMLPVKRHWRDKADLNLIVRSIGQLVLLATGLGWKRVALPRPGCGAGGLRWDEVGPLISDMLDDRFIIIERDP